IHTLTHKSTYTSMHTHTCVRATPSPSVVGATQMTAKLIPNSFVSNGNLKNTNAGNDVNTLIANNAYTMASGVLRTLYRSAVLSMRPDMRKTMKMLMNEMIDCDANWRERAYMPGDG